MKLNSAARSSLLKQRTEVISLSPSFLSSFLPCFPLLLAVVRLLFGVREITGCLVLLLLLAELFTFLLSCEASLQLCFTFSFSECMFAVVRMQHHKEAL